MHHFVHSPADCAQGEVVSPLDELDREFLALAGGSRPLTLLLPEGTLSGESQDRLPVDQIRATLAHPATPPEMRTLIWSELVSRAQRDGEPWVTVAVGMAVPVLRRILSRLSRRGSAKAQDLEQEVMAAFLTALHAADPLDPDLDRGMLRAADRAAHRHVYASRRHAAAMLLSAGENEHGDDLPGGEPTAGPGDEFEALVRAVRAGVLSRQEAQVIGRSRVVGESMTALAFELRMSRRQLYRYRQAAEHRLVTFLNEARA